jgi:hypothetical protein
MSTLTTLGLALVSLLAAPKITPKLPTTDAVPVLEKAPDGTPVLVLHTIVCAFQDGEPDALPYTAVTPAECEKVTRQTGELRRKNFKRLRIRAGKYIVRAVNVNVPWGTGFELRGERDVALPKISATDIAQGTGKEMKITLESGQYVYSDPVSKTPLYDLLVER